MAPTTKGAAMSDPARREEGRVALVSGAAGGLGPACCQGLADDGMTVVAVDLDGDRAGEVAEDLRTGGFRSDSATMDVRQRESVDDAIRQVVADHGRLDVVVNLAGVIRNAVAHKIDDDDFRLVIDTHLMGVLNTTRAAVPQMRSARYGRIVNMSSIAVRGSIAGGAYGAAKGAIEGFTRSVAMEAAPHGVTVNCVAPGLIAAGMFTTVPKDYQEQSLARVPMGRAGEADEVAACVSFLASSRASYVTGQTLFVSGGVDLGF